MTCNSKADELFIADFGNHVVRSMRVRENAGDMRDVYGGSAHDSESHICSVCHMRDSDTLLVCSRECRRWWPFEPSFSDWLVALNRRGGDGEWRETQRVKTAQLATLSCELSDARVLLGADGSAYLELFRMQTARGLFTSGPRIAHEHFIRVSETYRCVSATCIGIDTLVAISYVDQSVRVHRLVGDELEEITRVRLERPHLIVWIATRLLVSTSDSKGVVELEVMGTQLEHRGQLIAETSNFRVDSWCVLDYGLVVYNSSSFELLDYLLK